MFVLRVIKQPGEVAPLTWDFTADLAAGETITTATVTAQDLATGILAPSILAGTVAIATPLVTHKVTGGVSGGVYRVQCAATTNANANYEHETELHVLEE